MPCWPGILARRLLLRPAGALPDPLPAVTVLKPLHGDEPGLEAALASFLSQDYPAPVQIVFGLQDPADPAHAVVARLKDRFADRDIALVDRSAQPWHAMPRSPTSST